MPASNPDEIREFLESLTAVQVGVNGYTLEQRSKDFMATFSGVATPEQADRVLYQIGAMANAIFIGPDDCEKPGKLAFAAGMRYLYNEIISCMSTPREVRVEDASGRSESATSTAKRPAG